MYGTRWVDLRLSKGKLQNTHCIIVNNMEAENLFEAVRKCYCEVNKEYLEKQIQIASEYLTDVQKAELRSKGINV